MPTPAVIFREYDIRGAADRDLTDATVTAVGRALATELARTDGRPARVVLGRDCRLSSPRLHATMREGLLDGGVHVVDVGVGPTPLAYFAVHHLEADGGVMVTGSHNPAGDNGFKVLRGTASFFGQDLQRVRARVDTDEAAAGTAMGRGAPSKRGEATTADVSRAYVERLTAGIKVDPRLKVVVDGGNGAGGPLALAAMRALGLDPDPLFCEMDGRFPHHHPDPSVAANLEPLIARVRATGARVGVAYDGDGDRLGVVDADGTIVWGDRLLALFARGIIANHPGAAIVGEAKCSQTFYDDVARRGGRAVMWKAGHSLLRAKLREEGAMLAGDMSGHLFFADRYLGFDDALYASLRVLELLSADGRSLGAMLEDLPAACATPELRVDCPEAIKFELVRRVAAHFEARGHAVIGVDGARIQFGKPAGAAAGVVAPWGLVRASNTGAALVLRFEAPTESERDAVRADVEAVVGAVRAELAREQTT